MFWLHKALWEMFNVDWFSFSTVCGDTDTAKIKRSEKLLSVTVKYWWVIDNPPNTERKLGAIPNSIYKIHNPLGIKYLTRLGIGLTHLKEHKFKQ